MSVQLILYPQSYGGQFNTISSSPSEAVVNGISFTNLNSSNTYTSTASNPYLDTVTNEPASIFNTWYRFRKGSIAYPTVSLGDVTLVGDSSEISGLYQKLSNLTIGSQYTITINIPTAVVGGFVGVRAYSGTTLQTSTSYSSNTTQISKTFFAAATELTIMISYYNATSTDLTISSISTQPVIGAIPSGDTSILDNGQVILDLYEDEDLPLTLSVDNFKNVAEKVQSYSKAFNLPATKRNNKIFDQIFDITRSDDGVIFSPYKKSECVLKQDGFTLFKGYLRLLDVTDKNGEISYNVNLYSEVIALADFLKDSDFRDLDFTELSHDYNKTQIKYSWNVSGTGITYTNPNTSGFRNAYSTVKYPFVNWNNQMLIANGSTGSNATLNNPELTALEQAFRPFINIKYIIERIFENTPFTFTSIFFDTTDFKKLYMDFNWGSGNAPETSETTVEGGYFVGSASNYAPNGSYGNLQLTYPSGNLATVDYDTTTNKITATQDNTEYNISYSYEIDIVNVSPDPSYSARWLITRAAGGTEEVNLIPIQTITANQTITFSGTLSEILNNGDTLEPQFYSSWTSTNSIVQGFDGVSPQPLSTASVVIVKNLLSVTSETILQTLRGETGQWEFLKGLITMFNLVTMPDEDNPNNIKIEPYSDIFITSADSTELNWTEKVDISEMKLEPLTDLNRKTIFKFVEDEDDFAFTNYKNQVGGHLYGSKKYNAGNEFNILEGLDEIVAEPFASTVIKPLFDNLPQFITPALYSYNADDDTSEGFDNSPRIMFDNGIKSTGASYYIPPQNGLSSENQSQFLQFSHLSDVPTITTIPPATTDTRDFHFGECQLLTGVGNATANNLFNIYWLPYYSELYNPNTRIMTIKVNLSPADINTFKFNDTVMIKNRVFRVNKIDYKPNDLATVEFILIP